MFFQTQYFKDKIAEFRSTKYKREYGTCLKDLENEFASKTIEEMKALPELILHYDNLMFKKTRLRNSKQNLSKRDGYRVLYLVDDAKVVFLDIFPKRGSKAKNNVSDIEIQFLIQNYLKEVEEDKIIEIF